MDTARSQRIVLASVLTGGAVAAAGDISDGQVPRFTIVAGSFAAAFLLSVAAEFQPKMAAGFASIVLVGALLSSGVPAARYLTNLVGETQ